MNFSICNDNIPGRLRRSGGGVHAGEVVGQGSSSAHISAFCGPCPTSERPIGPLNRRNPHPRTPRSGARVVRSAAKKIHVFFPNGNWAHTAPPHHESGRSPRRRAYAPFPLTLPGAPADGDRVARRDAALLLRASAARRPFPSASDKQHHARLARAQTTGKARKMSCECGWSYPTRPAPAVAVVFLKIMTYFHSSDRREPVVACGGVRAEHSRDCGVPPSDRSDKASWCLGGV